MTTEQKIQSDINRMLTVYQKGQFVMARDLAISITKKLPNYILALKVLGAAYSQTGQLNDSLNINRKVVELNPEDVEAYNNLGVALEKLEKYEEAKNNYKKAIDLDPDYAISHNNLGSILKKINKLDDAKESFKRALTLRPDYVEAHYNLGNIYLDLERYDEAVESYCKALELNPKYTFAQENLILILDFFLPNKNINPIIIANCNIKNIKNNFTLEYGIKKNDLANFFKDSNKIIQDNIKYLTYDKTQIYRTNSLDLKCERHFGVFNKFNIIPKFCFNCFKIQIEPENILELFKLFFIFDKLELPKNNIRKCMVELRPNVLEPYKGLIYCSTIEEANDILEIISPIIQKITKCKIKIKRGCTEYVEKFPEYKEMDKNSINFMKYNDSWEEKEKIFDANKIINKPKPKNSLGGLSISDILIMNNWLNYAKLINDLSYKEIYKEVVFSNYIFKSIPKRKISNLFQD